MITKEAGKIDFDLRYDLAEKDYMNSGQSVRFHTKEFEFILYDKKKDLEKAKNGERSIEDDSDVQLNLFEKFIPKKSFEILRIEARLNTTQRIKKELNLSQEELTFKRLFKSDIAIGILNKYWNIIIENYQLMNFDIENKEIFKYSPLKSFSSEQQYIVEDILRRVNDEDKSASLINKIESEIQ